MTLLVAATFLVVLLLILSAYWLFVVRPESQEKLSLVSRLKGVRKQIASFSIVKAPERMSSIPVLDSALARRMEVAEPIQQLLTQAGMKTTVGAFVLTIVVAAVAAAVVSWLVFHLLIASIILALLAATLPYLETPDRPPARGGASPPRS